MPFQARETFPALLVALLCFEDASIHQSELCLQPSSHKSYCVSTYILCWVFWELNILLSKPYLAAIWPGLSCALSCLVQQESCVFA